MTMLLSYSGGNGRHDFDLNIDVSNVPERADALKKISRPVAGVYRGMSSII